MPHTLTLFLGLTCSFSISAWRQSLDIFVFPWWCPTNLCLTLWSSTWKGWRGAFYSWKYIMVVYIIEFFSFHFSRDVYTDSLF